MLYTCNWQGIAGNRLERKSGSTGERMVDSSRIGGWGIETVSGEGEIESFEGRKKMLWCYLRTLCMY